MTSWAMRPSSGGGCVSAPKNSSGISDGARCGRRRPRTSAGAGTSNNDLTLTCIDRLNKPPPSPPRDAPSSSDIDALEQAILINIRTAGLKPGRENQLAEEAIRLRRRRKGWLEDTEKVIREWAEHANLLWDLHEQELSKVNDFCREKNKQHGRSQTLLKKKLAEERERGCLATVQERDAAAAQLRAAQEVHELWKKAHHEEIAAGAQREMARTTVRLRHDAEQHTRSLKEALEAEYAERLSSITEEKEESDAKTSVAQKNASRLESMARRLEARLAEAAERTKRIERLSQTQKEVMEEMRVDLEKRARRLVRRLEDEEALNSQERSAHESAILAVRAQWKEELHAVDERVRTVVGIKNQVIQQLAEELKTARWRAETAEDLLEKLQLNICPIASSPARASTSRHHSNQFSPRRTLCPA